MSSVKKRGLGKGLEALIPEIVTFNVEEDFSEKIENININKVYPNTNQPRKEFDEASLKELAQSIKLHGFIQPLVVTSRENGYMIIAGERRWRAAMELRLTEVPCVIRKYNENQIMEIALIENLQREDLNIIEEAIAYKHIIEKYKVTQEQLSEALGKSRPYIANTLRLLHLENRIIEMIKEGKISGGHGRALLRLTEQQKQYDVALRIIEEKLNVRQVEDLVAKLLLPQQKSEAQPKIKDIIIVDIEESLKKLFGTKVTITSGNKKGKIEIEYYSEEDMERLLEMFEKIN